MNPEEELVRRKTVCAARRSSVIQVMNQADTLMGTDPLNVDELTQLQTSLYKTHKVRGFEC